MPSMVVVATQRPKLAPARTASALAAAQMIPRQKRSLERKTLRATKPLKKNIVVVSSRAKCEYGCDAAVEC
jgi:hypothetical protein